MRLHNKQLGFTLIEMIVSLAVFSIVIAIAVGALLMLIANNKKVQNEQSVMTNLSFALDSMTREIRTGTDYYCVDSIPADAFDIDDWTGGDDCSTNGDIGIAFVEAGDSITAGDSRIAYFYDASEQKLYRKVGGDDSQSIVSSGIEILDADFFITGADRLTDGNTSQPSVTIRIEAQEVGGGEKTYFIQTAVTQRQLDI